MPPTVKSLEERIDDVAEDMGEVKVQMASLSSRMDAMQNQMATMASQLAMITNTLSATQSQMAALATKLDTVVDRLRETNERLDSTLTRLDAFWGDYASFKSRTETSLAMIRWIGVFVAGVMVTAAVSAVSIAYSAGKLESSVLEQRVILDELRSRTK